MTRSHPPSLLTQVARTLREECDLPLNARILIAVSGGTDSMALVHALGRLSESCSLQVAACGIDHGLRAEAAQELDLAERYCAELGISFERVGVNLARGGNLQARARLARYAALNAKRLEIGYDFIATAHHADDRAETVLLRLLRGAPPVGLAVLPPRNGHLLRPLIRVSKLGVTAHRSHHNIPCAEDPSNRDPRFLRTRVRTELMPLLQQLSPGIVSHLTSLADELAEQPLPPLLGEDGEPAVLNRAQRAELRRTLQRRNAGARVLLSAGRCVTFDKDSGSLRLVSAADLAPADCDQGGQPRK